MAPHFTTSMAPGISCAVKSSDSVAKAISGSRAESAKHPTEQGAVPGSAASIVTGNGGAIRLSVIIPVLHEAASINECIRHVKHLEQGCDVEVIVVDAEDAGDTVAALDPLRWPEVAEAVCVLAPRGRANQMNAGAASASGDALLFLHADTRLPENGLRMICEALFPANGKRAHQAGAFALGYAGGSPWLHLMARLASFRNRLARTPYGDQAQFFRADAFKELGGFPAIPLMEDVAIMRTIREQKRPCAILRVRVATSPRRYEQRGLLMTGLRNNCLRLLYACGVPPERLKPWYDDHRDTHAS